MSLSDIASIVEIVGSFAILYGLFFGAIQLKQNRVQRRDLAILECTRLFEDKEFTEAYRLVQELPIGVAKDQIDELDDRYSSAAIRIIMKFETIGMLVHRGVIPLDAMEDLVGGAALATWQILAGYIEEVRKKSLNPMYMEWYQWLVERLQKQHSQEREPAYIRYADWQEPKI
jgi:hypothetical protein